MFSNIMTDATYRGKQLMGGVADSFRGRVHRHRGREHGGRQASMVLEKQLTYSVLINKQEAERELDRPTMSKPFSNGTPL